MRVSLWSFFMQLLLLGWALPAAAAPSPPIKDRFEGLDRIEAAHEGVGISPAETTVAVGLTKVLQASNAALRLSDRDGDGAIVRSLNEFFDEASSPLLVQPRVIFDRQSSRFFIVALSSDRAARRSFIHLAVARLRDPQGLSSAAEWCTYRLNAKRSGAFAADAGFGMNEKWVAISTDHYRFNNGAFRRAFLFVLNKFQLLDNASRCPNAQLTRFKLSRDAGGTTAMSVQPARHDTATSLPGRPLFLLSTQAVDEAADVYTLWQLTANAGERPKLSNKRLRSDASYESPLLAPQRQGTDLDTGGARITHAAFRDGILWGVHATRCNFGGGREESCIRALEIVPKANNATITFEETFGGGKDWHYWQPGVAINRRGDVLVPYLRSRPNKHLGVAYSGKQADRGGFDKVRTLANGSCGFENIDDEGRNRVGGAMGAQTDPRDDFGFWIAGEYPGNLPGLGCDWQTRIARVSASQPSGPPTRILASGTFFLPATRSRAFEDPGFHEIITLNVQMPRGLNAPGGSRLVVALHDASRPGRTCNDEHPISGCATIDYSASGGRNLPPGGGVFDNSLTLDLNTGPRTFHLSENLTLADVPDQFVPG